MGSAARYIACDCVGLCDLAIIYRMDEIKSLSFHIMFYRLFRGIAKYFVYGNNFLQFE